METARRPLRVRARWLLRRLDPWRWARIQYARLGPWLEDRRGRGRLRELDQAALRERRRSERVYVFGSGWSVNRVAPSGWDAISRHDTISFNYFPHQRFVRADFHLTGELITGDDLDRRTWEAAVRDYAALITDNPLYARTVIGLQEGWPALQSNRLVALGLLPEGTSVFRYRRVARGAYRPPARSLAEGLVHGAGSLVAVVNFAYQLGWREIVLVGVDLYDARYFWLDYDEPRPDLEGYFVRHRHSVDQPFSVSRTLVPYLGGWGRLMEAEGVRLSVLNPRSLLAGVLPVHDAVELLPEPSG